MSLISQSSSEQSICFAVPGGAGKRARARLLEEFHDEIGRKDIDGIDVQDGLATVAVVGLGMAGHRGIAARVFAALADAGINIVAIAQGSSELNISFVVAAKDAAPAQRAVHAAFQLAKIGGGAATRAAHRDVVLLGFGQIGRALAGIMAKESKKTVGGKRNGASKLRLAAAIDTTGFVFDPGGLTARVVGELADAKQSGRSLAEARGGRPAKPADALTLLSQHALANPILVDLTAADTTPLVLAAVDAGMDVVLANKRPLAGPRRQSSELWEKVAAANQRMLTEATVGAGLPIFDSYRKLVESGDRVLKIEGCLSGTLGFVLTEVERGKSFSQALRGAMDKGYTEPDPRDDLSGADVGPQGADPRAAARVRGRAGRRRGRIAGAGGAARDRARRVPRAPRRDGRRLGEARHHREGEERDAALRRLGQQGQDLRRARDGEPAEPVLRPQGDRQPGGVHDRPLPEEPARHHRPRRRPRRHRRRRAERPAAPDVAHQKKTPA